VKVLNTSARQRHPAPSAGRPTVPPDDLVVTAGGVSIPRDPSHQDGWDYGAVRTPSEFSGAAAIAIAAGTLTQIAASQACPDLDPREAR